MLFCALIAPCPAGAIDPNGPVWDSRDEWLRAPIELPNDYPLATIHLSPFLFDAAVLAPGTWEATLTSTISNTVNREKGAFLVDMESRAIHGIFRYGTPLGEIFLRQGLQWRGGGETDHIIDEWHQIFGLPRGPRARIPMDRFVVEGTNDDGSEFSLTEDGTAFGDLALGMKFPLFSLPSVDPSSEWHPAWRGAAGVMGTLPTGENQYGHAGVDLGVSAMFRASFRSFDWNTSVHVVRNSDREIENLHFPAAVGTVTTSVTVPLLHDVALVVGVLAHSGVTTDVEQFPDYGVYLDTGLRWQIADQLGVDFTLRENPIPDDGTTDITLAARLVVRSAPFEGAPFEGAPFEGAPRSGPKGVGAPR